jgi:hypothetical protein
MGGARLSRRLRVVLDDTIGSDSSLTLHSLTLHPSGLCQEQELRADTARRRAEQGADRTTPTRPARFQREPRPETTLIRLQFLARSCLARFKGSLSRPVTSLDQAVFSRFLFCVRSGRPRPFGRREIRRFWCDDELTQLRASTTETCHLHASCRDRGMCHPLGATHPTYELRWPQCSL